MTVAAYDGKTLVVDGKMTWGNQPLVMIEPKALICGRWVIATAGETRLTLAVLDGLRGATFGEDELPVLPSLNGGDLKFEALAIGGNGRVAFYLASPLAVELDMGMMAIGSGCDLAIGAMAHGATALEAAKIAATHDKQCGPPFFIYLFTGKLGGWEEERVDD